MPILLIDVPVSAVAIDEVKFADSDTSQILEHLVRYTENSSRFRAITILIDGNTATVLRGHKYLLAARMLIGRVRAVVASPPSSKAVKDFIARPDVTIVDWDAIKAEEDQKRTPRGWHVFFFGRMLSADEKRVFDGKVRALFADPSIHVHHDDAGPAAEFEAVTPVTDPVWIAKHLEVFRLFARDYAPIVSYQGRRFVGS